MSEVDLMHILSDVLLSAFEAVTKGPGDVMNKARMKLLRVSMTSVVKMKDNAIITHSHCQ